MSRNYNTPTRNKTWPYFWPNLDPDFALDMAYIKEYHEQHFPPVPYYVLQTQQAELDDLHQEIEEHLKTWADPVDLVTWVTINPTEKLLARFGIDNNRDIVLVPSIVKLVDVGLCTLSDPRDPTSDPVIPVKPGDKFVFDGREFSVLDYHREKYHASYNKPTYIAISGEILKGSSFGFPTPVGDDDDPR